MNKENAKKLVAFMAHFCWNCSTEHSFATSVDGYESNILDHFARVADLEVDEHQFVTAAYEAANYVQVGG